MTDKKRIRKCAWIRTDRGDGKECPFGLPITLACQNAGESIAHMCPLEAVPDDKQARTALANKRVYIHQKTGERCLYAKNIMKKQDAVNCNFSDAAEGMGGVAFEGSPLYAQNFAGVGLDGLYAFPLGFYADNNSSRNLFQGLFSLLGENILQIVKEAVSKEDEILWDKVEKGDILLPEEQDRLNLILEKCRRAFEDDRTDAAKAHELASKYNPTRGR